MHGIGGERRRGRWRKMRGREGGRRIDRLGWECIKMEQKGRRGWWKRG